MTRIEVVNHNIGGGTTYGEGLWSDGLARTGSVMRLVQDFGADAITLQECTESQFEFWRNQNGWFGTFIPMVEAIENSTGERKGQAVLSRYPMIDSHVEPLGVNGLVATGKEFNLLCAAFDHPGFTGEDTLWIATTHLWAQGHDPLGNLYSAETNDAVRNFQAGKIADYLNPRVGYARKYVFTGDLNTTAKTTAIDNFHKVNRNGTIGTTAKFWEGDQSQDSVFGAGNLGRGGRDTVVGRKIDYWFASHSGATAHEAGLDMALHDASINGGVPHEKILRGWVTWTDVS